MASYRTSEDAIADLKRIYRRGVREHGDAQADGNLAETKVSVRSLSMSNTKTGIPPKLQPWIQARERFRLSHSQVQMARELGMNPRKLGGLANHRQEPWKAPLPQFIQQRYERRFGKSAPDDVRSIEEKLRARAEK